MNQAAASLPQTRGASSFADDRMDWGEDHSECQPGPPPFFAASFYSPMNLAAMPRIISLEPAKMDITRTSLHIRDMGYSSQ